MSDVRLIKDGDFVLIECNSMYVFLDRVTSIRKIKIHHAKFAAEKIIGLRFGTLLEVVDGDIHEISEQQFATLAFGGLPEESASLAVEGLSANPCDIAGDNRHLIAMPENQKLSETEIKNLKRTGYKGSEVVSFLVENSSTFQQKTMFSKEKYLKRKHKKHRIIIRLQKPSIPLLADWTTQRGRQRIGGLSTDTLSQMLSYGNISSGGRYIVFDNCGGLTLLSLLHRLGGNGLIVDLHTSSQPTRNVYYKVFDAVQMPEKNMSIVESFPLRWTETLAQEEFLDTASFSADQEKCNNNDSGLEATAKNEKRKARYEKLKTIWSLLKKGEFDGLIIATRNDPLPIVQAYFDFVKLSRPIVVFHQYRELLAPCFSYLAASGRWVMSSMVSNLCREIQVLPGRTHPVIQMHGPSGYILFGTKLFFAFVRLSWEMSYPFELDPSSPLVERYRGTLISAIYDLLDKLQSQGVSSKLVLDRSAASFIELVLFDFIKKMCSRIRPQSAQDLSEYVLTYFPEPMKTRYSLSVMDLFESTPVGNSFSRHFSSSNNSALVMPADKIQNMLSRDILHNRTDLRLARYLAALLQVIVNDILVFVRRYVLMLEVEVISEAEVRTAINADHKFLSIFTPDAAGVIHNTRSSSEGDDDQSDTLSICTSTASTMDTISIATVTPTPFPDEQPLDYAEQVKRLYTEESINVRDLHTVIRLFKVPLDAIINDRNQSDDIFGNVDEVLGAAELVLSTLEDTIEAAEESNQPLIGEAMLDLAGEAVLEVYNTYAETVLSPSSSTLLASYLQKPEVHSKLECSSQFVSKIRNYQDCFRYVVPRLLLKPLQHCWKFFEHLEALVDVNPDSDDKDSLHQSIGVLHPLRARLTPYQKILQRPRRLTKQEALEQVTNLGKLLESWREKPLHNCCTELIHEGTVFKHNDRTRRAQSERYLLLFDTLLLLCKRAPLSLMNRVARLPTVPVPHGSSNTTYTYRVKEKLALRHFRVIDLPDCPEYANAFQIESFLPSESSASPLYEDVVHTSVSSTSSIASTSASNLSFGHTKGSFILLAPSYLEKQNWMYNLLWLLTKPAIDKLLDVLLNDQTALHIPENYRFSERDSPANIIFEERPLDAGIISGPPLIKGATLPKLIERLTYHEYADTKFMKTFATTYRSFCKPRELLKLLIERFSIPEHSPNDQESTSIVSFETEEEDRRTATEMRKFRKEYVKPVQFRVLNFIRHWILNHSYDFSDDPKLKEDLVAFITSIRAPHLRRWVTRLVTHIEKIGTTTEERETVFAPDQTKPQILYHLRDKPISLMTLHPVELARQVTLLEFAAFSRIRPCELMGTTWTKSTKYDTSPNVMRCIDFHTELTYWLERNIVEAKNFEERVAVCERIADVLAEFKNLNNFSGQYSIASVFDSAPIHRLTLTMESLKPEKKRAITEAQALHENHNREYAIRLKTCNPPCVPFLGMWLSRLLHVEEGNIDFLDGVGVINFSKCRRTAEYITEIQQYQNQPYCLDIEPDIRAFFEHLDARETKSRPELEDYLFEMSQEIEPRGSSVVPIFPRRFDFPLIMPPTPSSISAGTSRRVSRDQPARSTSTSSSGTQSSSMGNRRRAVPLVLQPSGMSVDDSDSRSVLTGGSSSSSSLPSTPFPTPPSSALPGHQHFFASSTSSSLSSTAPGPPLPPRPADLCSSTGLGCSAPPCLPQRPIQSPPAVGHALANHASSGSMAPPPPPPRTSAQFNVRTRPDYPVPPPAENFLLPPTVPNHRRQNSQ